MKNIFKGFKNFVSGFKEGNKGFEIVYKCCKDNSLKVKNIKPCFLKEGLNGYYDIKESVLYFDTRLLELTKTKEGCDELYNIIYSIIAFVI